MAERTFDHLFKLLLIGNRGVGKSTLFFKYGDDAFNSTFFSTIGIDFKIKTVFIKGKRCRLQIWNTFGNPKNPYHNSVINSYYRRAVGVMLFYDITNLKSFESIPKWILQVEENADESIQKILVGNKCDLEGFREVSQAQGHSFALQHNMDFQEISVKENINVDEAFENLATRVFDRMIEKESSRINDGQNSNRREKCCIV